MPFASVLVLVPNVTRWLYQPFESGARSAVTITCGAVVSSVKPPVVSPESSPWALVTFAVIVIEPSVSPLASIPVTCTVSAPSVAAWEPEAVWPSPSSSVTCTVSLGSEVAGTSTSMLTLPALEVLTNALPTPRPFASVADVGAFGLTTTTALLPLSAPRQL